jgi:hypothetical protein
MKRFLALAVFCAFALGLRAQVVDTTVCDVLKNPKSFDGKMVRIKATVAVGFDQFVLKGPGCGHYINDIWLSYPEGSKAKAGPAAILQIQMAHNFTGTVPAAVTRTPVTLDKSKDFKQFDTLLSTPHKGAAMCLGCNRYEVTATLVGRMDGVDDAGVRRDAAGKIVGVSGFGNLNGYKARLVLQSVADVTPQEVDFSKTDPITKSDSPSDMPDQTALNAIEAAHKAALAFPGNPAGAQIERAAAAFGKPGEHNGVNILLSATNEAAAKDEAQGVKDSPDGVLYNCAFNMNRLPGISLTRAIVHMGVHIADLRNPPADLTGPSLSDLEFRAWVTTVVSAIANNQKTLTAPGGYLLWNSGWPPTDRDKVLNDTMEMFIVRENLLSR